MKYYFIIFTLQKKLFTLGKDATLEKYEGCGITQATVLSLVEHLHHKGHHLYMDNLYTSPALFSTLKSSGIGACGTHRTNRKGVPSDIKSAKLGKGGVVTANGDEEMLFLKWKDKREVAMLTTIHDDSCITVERRSRAVPGGTEEVSKPYAIDQYNKFMGGVDKQDQFLSYYGFTRRTVKWWKKVFFYLLDSAVVNAYIMYTQAKPGIRKLTHVQFRLELVKQLLLYDPVVSSQTIGRSLQPSSRLTERHFLEKVPSCPNGKQSQRDCAVCSMKKGRKRKTTVYQCKQCGIGCCVVPCFELYLTKSDPLRYLPRAD